jgi:hypothetical protein
MLGVKNSWYCSVCNFNVFNSKKKCSKCLTEKPKTSSPLSKKTIEETPPIIAYDPDPNNQ